MPNLNARLQSILHATLSWKRTSLRPNRRRGQVSAVVETLNDRVMLSANPVAGEGLMYDPETGLIGHSHDHDDDHDHSEHDHDEPHASPFQAQDSDRWSQTATNGSGLGQGDATTLTWSIVPDGTVVGQFADEADSASDLISFLGGIYGVTTNDTDYTDEAWFSVFTTMFDRLSSVSGIRFVYEANDDGAAWATSSGSLGTRGDIRISGHEIDGQDGSNTLAYNFFPNFGDMVIDTTNTTFYGNTANNSLAMRNVLTHEIAHGLGIGHVESSDANFLLEPFIDLSFDGPQYDDILALQRLYGDNYEFDGNDTVATADSLGTLTAGGTLSLGLHAADTTIAANETDIVSIDDDSDIDIWSFSIGSSLDVTVTLTPVGPTYNQGPQGGSQSSFNASTQSDLTLELLSSDGTVLHTANTNGAGVAETLSGITLNAGTYLVRVTGAADAAQTYSLGLSGAAAANKTDHVGIFRNGRWFADANGTGSYESNGVGQDIFRNFGISGDTPIVGDWNGDGIDDIGVKRDKRWFLDANGSGVWDSGDTFFVYGFATDSAVVGDFNGDGRDTIGIHRITNGQSRFYLDANGNGTWDGPTAGNDIYVQFGISGDKPVAGDFNGDGTDTVGVNRTVNNQNRFYLDANGDRKWSGTGEGNDIYVSFGVAGDTAVIGDFNGDGKDTVGVHRFTTVGAFTESRFYLDADGSGSWSGTGANADIYVSFGVNNDLPVIGAWV